MRCDSLHPPFRRAPHSQHRNCGHAHATLLRPRSHHRAARTRAGTRPPLVPHPVDEGAAPGAATAAPYSTILGCNVGGFHEPWLGAGLGSFGSFVKLPSPAFHRCTGEEPTRVPLPTIAIDETSLTKLGPRPASKARQLEKLVVASPNPTRNPLRIALYRVYEYAGF